MQCGQTRGRPTTSTKPRDADWFFHVTGWMSWSSSLAFIIYTIRLSRWPTPSLPQSLFLASFWSPNYLSALFGSSSLLFILFIGKLCAPLRHLRQIFVRLHMKNRQHPHENSAFVGVSCEQFCNKSHNIWSSQVFAEVELSLKYLLTYYSNHRYALGTEAVRFMLSQTSSMTGHKNWAHE